MPVDPTGILGPIECEACADHFSGQVAAVLKITSGHQPLVGESAGRLHGDDLLAAKANQRPFCVDPPWMIELGRIDPEQANIPSGNNDRVTINDMRAPSQVRVRSRGRYRWRRRWMRRFRSFGPPTDLMAGADSVARHVDASRR